MAQKIHPFLWFHDQAEEAMNFYVSIFRNAKAGEVTRWGEGGPGEPGSVLTANFTLAGMEFTALNGNPDFRLNESVSFYIDCESQEEVDYYWNALIADGGEESMCGWLKDKYGLSWQVIPSALPRLMTDPDPEKANRVMQAMMQMRKIDVARLEAAHAGG